MFPSTKNSSGRISQYQQACSKSFRYTGIQWCRRLTKIDQKSEETTPVRKPRKQGLLQSSDSFNSSAVCHSISTTDSHLILSRPLVPVYGDYHATRWVVLRSHSQRVISSVFKNCAKNMCVSTHMCYCWSFSVAVSTSVSSSKPSLLSLPRRRIPFMDANKILTPF